MKRTICIIDDHKDEYLELKSILQEKEIIKEFDVIVLNDHFGEKPFEPAIDFIRKERPDILFIDYNLRKKTGDDLFKEINNYKCYAIFISNIHAQADIINQFDNATFLNKRVDPFVEPKKLHASLTRAINYLEKDSFLTFDLFDTEKQASENEKEHKHTLSILCDDVIRIQGGLNDARVYQVEYRQDNTLKKGFGRVRSGVGTIADYIIDHSSLFVIYNKKPYIVFNKKLYQLNKEKKLFELKDGILPGVKLSFAQ